MNFDYTAGIISLTYGLRRPELAAVRSGLNYYRAARERQWRESRRFRGNLASMEAKFAEFRPGWKKITQDFRGDKDTFYGNAAHPAAKRIYQQTSSKSHSHDNKESSSAASIFGKIISDAYFVLCKIL